MIKATHPIVGLAVLTALACSAAMPARAQGKSATRSTPANAARPTPAPAAASAPLASPAPSGTGDVARAAFIQSMDAEYRKQDLDGDGRVTRAEVEQFQRNAAIAKAQAQNQVLFDTLDTDRNGMLSPGEFAGLLRNLPVPDVSAQMQRFDTNRDQVITLVEYRTATLANFDRLDADKDGIVTERELAASAAPANSAPGR